MASKYPGALDSLPTNSGSSTNAREGKPTGGPTGYHSGLHNDTSAAVNAVQETLGVNPQGEQSSVGARIAAIEAGGGGGGLSKEEVEAIVEEVAGGEGGLTKGQVEEIAGEIVAATTVEEEQLAAGVQAKLAEGEEAKSLLPVFNVKEFGAKGDETTDDAAAISEAHSAAKEAGGGVVFLPAGIYLVGSTLVIDDGITIQGAGKEVTTIKLGDDKNVPILKTARFEEGGEDGGAMGFAIRDVAFDGNGAENATMTSPVIDLDGLAFTVDHVWVHDGAAVNLESQMSRENPLSRMEAHVNDLFLEDAGVTNLTWEGPHDSVLTGVIARADCEEANIVAGSIANWSDCHAYGNSKYSFEITGFCAFNNCNAEGAREGQVAVFKDGGVMWNGGRVFYGGGEDGRIGFVFGKEEEGGFACQITGVEVANCDNGAFVFSEAQYHGAKNKISGFVYGEEEKPAVVGEYDATVDFSGLTVAAPMEGPTQGGTSIQMGVPLSIPGTLAAGEVTGAHFPLNEGAQAVKSFAVLVKLSSGTCKLKISGTTSSGTTTTLVKEVAGSSSTSWHELEHTFTEEEFLAIEVESTSSGKNLSCTVICQYDAP